MKDDVTSVEGEKGRLTLRVAGLERENLTLKEGLEHSQSVIRSLDDEAAEYDRCRGEMEVRERELEEREREAKSREREARNKSEEMMGEVEEVRREIEKERMRKGDDDDLGDVEGFLKELDEGEKADALSDRDDIIRGLQEEVERGQRDVGRLRAGLKVEREQVREGSSRANEEAIR